MEFIIFFILFLITGFFTILSVNPIHSILGLISIFFLGSCFSIFLGIEFLAFLILIVYVGAISVLFLFVVMLLNIKIVELNSSIIKYWWLGAIYSIFFFVHFLYIWNQLIIGNPSWTDTKISYAKYFYLTQSHTNIEILAEMLYIYYPHLLILISLILFVAIVSPVILNHSNFQSQKSILNIKNKEIGKKSQIIFYQTLRRSTDSNYLDT